MTTLQPTASAPDATLAGVRTLEVAARMQVAEDAVELTLRRPDGGRLPDWAPGAHLDLVLPDGRSRQYSLCGDRWDAHTYRVAIRREPQGRGGSVWLHDEARPGTMLGFAGPRNSFRMAPAERYLLVAGGIGITPLLPMVRQAEMIGADWHLLYLGRGLASLPYLEELEAHGDRVTVHCGDTDGRADLDAWLPTDPSVRVYACGPERLLDAVEAWAPRLALPPRVERFAARIDDRPGRPFEVVASRSGVSTAVGADETVVAALRRVGVEVITSCAQGVCGTCEADVLEGTPDHRDSVLDEHARASGTCLLPCVSRCLDDRLVLDL
ncbi:PDR/VanB family oxidoreductase [Demequina sp. SYSU T00192]|uniref:PDR/VanB family oxidoreductase n=1 Tax=Demequina litoralis TaxID=3051660 RepID=A0ABT8G6H0_9MICO|nr:PDR/VanB family oxidoreductase [Demequina sp. SYSU T00192]MDN4474740.1 PDR/VanB family oxidoreductase [Demequina sp. SYSU T00192]